MKKILVGLGVTLLLSSFLVHPGYAGQWKKDTNTLKWSYYRDDNSLPANEWERIDGSLYYFDDRAQLLTNTTTPDGYAVDGNGVWRQDVPRTDWEKDENGQNVELMRYYSFEMTQNNLRRIKYNALETMLAKYNFWGYSNSVLINDYIYVTAVRYSDAKGKYLNPVNDEDPAKYEYCDSSLLRVPVDKDTVGTPEIIVNYEKSNIRAGNNNYIGVNITHAAQGKLCLKYTNNTYGLYDIATGKFLESSYEQNESMRIAGKYSPEDYHYYEMQRTSDSDTCKIIVRNYKNEIEREFNINACRNEFFNGKTYFNNPNYLGVEGDNILIGRTTITNVGNMKGNIYLGSFGSNLPDSAVFTAYRLYFNKYNGNFVKYEIID